MAKESVKLFESILKTKIDEELESLKDAAPLSNTPRHYCTYQEMQLFYAIITASSSSSMTGSGAGPAARYASGITEEW
jgi:hypothetical protein